MGPTRREIEQAARRFREFTGDDPKFVDSHVITSPKSGLIIGTLDGLLYTTVRDGEQESYIHKFRKKSRPLLAASHDGKSLIIVGGRYEFTERGIEDR